MAQEIIEEIYVGQVALKALITHEDRVLISLDLHVENWDLPGGRIHRGENPKEALAREVLEEIGVAIEVGEPFFTGFAGTARFMIVYKAKLTDPTMPFTLASDEIKEVRWITKDELHLFPFWEVYKKALEAYFASVTNPV